MKGAASAALFLCPKNRVKKRCIKNAQKRSII